MRLVRVQVPEFRALKDVDISFEPEFTPQVFPLGSLNGGGKSTLLQLIFVLLHCSSNSDSDEKKVILIKNLLSNINIEREETQKTIAVFDILYEDLILQFRFFCCNDKYLKDLPIAEAPAYQSQVIYESSHLGKVANNPLSFDTIENGDRLLSLGIINSLEKRNVYYITNVSEKLGFCFELQNDDLLGRVVLSNLSKNIFLIAPSNQSYLFLSKEKRRLLFISNISAEKTYDQVLKELRNHIHNFFTYDFIDVITEVLRLARDKDFDEKLKTGVYGTHYEQLENAINSLFIDGKKIIPLTVDQKRHTKDSIQSMGFKLPSGEEIYPEDLSHGELKRLAIFVLIKYHEIHDAIVLMDEIENGFHPDWQYQIVHDLVEWGENNQYILATHSYELCNALTPAHVKELEPKLVNN